MLSGTLLLYVFIFFSTTFLVSQSQRRRADGVIVFEKSLFLISFLIHWFFIAFTQIGTDHDQYLMIIMYDSDRLFEMGSEVGFNGACILLRELTGNPEVVIFIFKTIALVFTYVSLFLMRKHASLGYAVAAFNVWEYLYGFYIIAHSLAISIVFFAAVLLLRKAKWYWPLLLSLLAFSIHASALVIVFVFIAVEVLNLIKYKPTIKTVLVLIVASMAIISFVTIIFESLIQNIVAFEQYSRYSDSDSNGTGLFNYFVFSYILLVLVFSIVRSTLPLHIRNACVMFFIYGLTSSIIGYFIGSARLNQYTIVLYGVVIPWYFYQIRNGYAKGKHFFPFKFERFTWVIYLLFVAFMTLRAYTNPAGSADIDSYELFNPFTWHGSV